jgi:hypothetical protein
MPGWLCRCAAPALVLLPAAAGGAKGVGGGAAAACFGNSSCMVFHNATLTFGCQPVTVCSSIVGKIAKHKGKQKMRSSQEAVAAVHNHHTGKGTADRSRRCLSVCCSHKASVSPGYCAAAKPRSRTYLVPLPPCTLGTAACAAAPGEGKLCRRHGLQQQQ